ncbi:rab-GTPase-TBC domain-containing protein [Cyathus striatus]|nr:rab-GTPase-TBC domain-containing protein [Cyathus striatus]
MTYTDLRNAYDHFFSCGISISKLRDSTLADRLHVTPTESFGIPGRSLAWKLFLVNDEPLQSILSPNVPALQNSLGASRRRYYDLLLEKMKAPDGSYEAEFTLPGLSTLPRPKYAGNLEQNNPLSLHVENPWNEWFASVELRKTILQDVERTFPEILFFRDPSVQTELTAILFLYSSTHPSIGYRQGMHELLAPLYYAVSYDAMQVTPQDGIYPELQELCSKTWISADAWALFEAVMRGVSQWYEWKEPMPSLSRAKDPLSPLATHVHLHVSEGGIEPYVAPIVKACIRIQSDLLASTDPQLCKALQKTGIEPQIYGIRWLRMLFTREFAMADAMKIWDGLFASDPTLELAQWICVAMLIRVRNFLIPGDYSTQLTTLLRYPSPPSECAMPEGPHHTSLLIRQALALQLSPTPATGTSLMLENRNLLNIAIDIPTTPLPSRRGHNGRQASGSGNPTVSQGHARQGSGPQMRIPEMIARGLLERGESLGINKTVMSAVSELRRNIPDLASSLVRTPTQVLSSFPLEDERPVEERPPWEPRTRFEIEKDVARIEIRDRRLGEALGWIVDSLLQDEEGSEEKMRLKKKKHEALESLSYVRDVLVSNKIELDEDRLVGEEEASERKAKAERERGDAEARRARAAVVVPPTPLPVVDSGVRRQEQMKSDLRKSGMLSGMGEARRTRGGEQRSESATAPWNHTPSRFSTEQSGGGLGLGAETLPRMPPRTSMGHGKGDQTPQRYEDPLGALR